MCEKQEDHRLAPKYTIVNNEQQQDLLEEMQSKQKLASLSRCSNTFISTRRKTIYTTLFVLIIVGGIMAVIIPYYKTKNKDIINNSVSIGEDSNNDDEKSDGLPQLRSGSAYRDAPYNLGHTNIFIRKPSPDGSRRRPQPFRFPVARYSRQRFPLSGPFLSFTPWIPIFADRLTKQTIIYSPSGIYIFPPVINFYGKMYSVAELIVFGYASLVSSGVPPAGPINMLPYFQPTPLIGPAVPRINPATGIFHGAIRTDYGPFDIPRYARATYSVDPPYERETEEDEDYNPPPSYQREEEEQNYISAPRPYKKKPYYKPESYKPQTYKPYTKPICNLNFGSPVKYAPGTAPKYVDVTDINNDKTIDIIATYETEGKTRILIGNGDGTFQSPIVIDNGVGTEPFALAVADLNHDNNIDMVIGYRSKNKVAVFLGDGAGQFNLFQTYSTDPKPGYIVLRDVNGDNKIDMLVACQDGNTVLVYTGNNDGTFNSFDSYSTGANSVPSNIVVDDLNKDHKLDFIVSCYGTNDIKVFLGTGNGKFTKDNSYSTDKGPFNLVLGDFNYDGKLDVATANFEAASVNIFRGKGDGKFVLTNTLSTGAGFQPNTITASDLNNDKILDLVLPSVDTSTIGVFIGIGDGNFRKFQTYSTGSNSGPFWVAIADFNDDGLKDVVTPNSASGDVGVLLNKCS